MGKKSFIYDKYKPTFFKLYYSKNKQMKTAYKLKYGSIFTELVSCK